MTFCWCPAGLDFFFADLTITGDRIVKGERVSIDVERECRLLSIPSACQLLIQMVISDSGGPDLCHNLISEMTPIIRWI